MIRSIRTIGALNIGAWVWAAYDGHALTRLFACAIIASLLMTWMRYERATWQTLRAMRNLQKSPKIAAGHVYIRTQDPLVQFMVRCPSCQAVHSTKIDCSLLVFDVFGLRCPCGALTDLRSPSKEIQT